MLNEIKEKKQLTIIQMILIVFLGVPLGFTLLIILLLFIVAISPFITVYLVVSKVLDSRLDKLEINTKHQHKMDLLQKNFNLKDKTNVWKRND